MCAEPVNNGEKKRRPHWQKKKPRAKETETEKMELTLSEEVDRWGTEEKSLMGAAPFKQTAMKKSLPQNSQNHQQLLQEQKPQPKIETNPNVVLKTVFLETVSIASRMSGRLGIHISYVEYPVFVAEIPCQVVELPHKRILCPLEFYKAVSQVTGIKQNDLTVVLSGECLNKMSLSDAFNTGSVPVFKCMDMSKANFTPIELKVHAPLFEENVRPLKGPIKQPNINLKMEQLSVKMTESVESPSSMHVVFKTMTGNSFTIPVNPREPILKACLKVARNETLGPNILFLSKVKGKNVTVDLNAEAQLFDSKKDMVIFIQQGLKCNLKEEMKSAESGSLMSLFRVLLGSSSNVELMTLIKKCSDNILEQLASLQVLENDFIISIPESMVRQRNHMVIHNTHLFSESEIITSIRYFGHKLSSPNSAAVLRAAKALPNFKHSKVIAKITLDALEKGNVDFVAEVMNAGLKFTNNQSEDYDFSATFWDMLHEKIALFVDHKSDFLFTAYGHQMLSFKAMWSLYLATKDESFGLEVTKSAPIPLKDVDNPINQAMDLRHFKVIKSLVKDCGCDIDSYKTKEPEPQKDILYGRSLQPTTKPEMHKVPLLIAAMKNDIKMAVLLIQLGADVNFNSKNGSSNMKGTHNTPLTAASFYGHSEMIVLLVENGATLDMAEVVIDSIINSNVATLRFIIANANGTKLHSILQKHVTATGGVLNRGNSMWIDTDQNLNVQYRNSQEIIGTLLHLACRRNTSDEILEILLQHFNVNITDQMSITPLYEAVQHNQLGVARFLIRNHADVNVQSNGVPIFSYAAPNSEMRTLLSPHVNQQVQAQYARFRQQQGQQIQDPPKMKPRSMKYT